MCVCVTDDEEVSLRMNLAPVLWTLTLDKKNPLGTMCSEHSMIVCLPANSSCCANTYVQYIGTWFLYDTEQVHHHNLIVENLVNMNIVWRYHVEDQAQGYVSGNIQYSTLFNVCQLELPYWSHTHRVPEATGPACAGKEQILCGGRWIDSSCIIMNERVMNIIGAPARGRVLR